MTIQSILEYYNRPTTKIDNLDAKRLINSFGLERAVTTIRPNQFTDESTAAMWEEAENAIVKLVQHLGI